MKNITLIGMPGSGKSVIGKLLAKKLNYSFIDSDILIESSGIKLQTIIDCYGDHVFLKIEEAVLLKLEGDNLVFSPGGSCVLSDKAMVHLNNISLIVFLDLPFEIIEERLNKSDITKRGIIGLKDKNLKDLYLIRKPLYQKYAVLTINLNKQSIDQSLKIIADKI
ncbi:MAG: shikimate kinase [Nanoarchaeota archaeon]